MSFCCCFKMGEIIACLNADKNDLAEGKQMMLERWGLEYGFQGM